jgi:uncharacterized spore protein YtfJ
MGGNSMDQQKMVQEITKTITDTLKDMANTEVVVGKPFKLGEYEVVPVISLRIGFGTGGGDGDHPQQGKGTGAGGGAGIKVEPVAFIASSGKEITLLNLKGKGLDKVIENMPHFMTEMGKSIKDILEKRKEEKTSE